MERVISDLLVLHFFARSDANHARHTFTKKREHRKNLNESLLGFARLSMEQAPWAGCTVHRLSSAHSKPGCIP